jgi:hypothetical protein
MVIFAAVAMVVIVVAGFVLLASTGWATESDADAEVNVFLGILTLGIPGVWSVLNLALLVTRHQTGGQYVAGLMLGREDRRALANSNAVAWWFCFNPLLFSWPMAIAAGVPLAGAAAVLLGAWTVIVFGIVVTLCLLIPVVALISAALDSNNRALHDRVVGTIVVPADSA